MKNISRRKFIGKSLTGFGVFCIVPRYVLGGNGHTPPSDQLTRAVIGVGGMGRWHLGIPGAKLIAVCDVDQQHLKRALDLSDSDVKGYTDYRELLQRDDIDVVHDAVDKRRSLSDLQGGHHLLLGGNIAAQKRRAILVFDRDVVMLHCAGNPHDFGNFARDLVIIRRRWQCA